MPVTAKPKATDLFRRFSSALVHSTGLVNLIYGKLPQNSSRLSEPEPRTKHLASGTTAAAAISAAAAAISTAAAAVAITGIHIAAVIVDFIEI